MKSYDSSRALPCRGAVLSLSTGTKFAKRTRNHVIACGKALFFVTSPKLYMIGAIWPQPITMTEKPAGMHQDFIIIMTEKEKRKKTGNRMMYERVFKTPTAGESLFCSAVQGVDSQNDGLK